MACTAAHGYVLASGRCVDCGQPVLAAGALGPQATSPGRGWLAPPFTDPDAAGTCLTGLAHDPGHATGACADCGASLEALDGLWFTTPPDTADL